MSTTNVVSAPDSINPASIDYSALMAKAMAHPAGNDSAPETPVTPAPAHVETPTPAAPVLETPTQTPATPEAPAQVALTPAEAKILDLPEDGQIRVKIDGKEELVPVAELRNGYSRESVFTKRMQSLAEQKKVAEAELAAKYAQIQAQAAAVQQMQQHVLSQMQTPAQPQVQTPVTAPNPGELATMGDVQSTFQTLQSTLQAEYKAREEQMLKALGQATQKIQSDAEQARNAAAYNAGLTSVLAKPDYQVLAKALPFAEESIRYQVAAMDPQSIDEAVQFTEQVAREWTSKLKAQFVDAQQRHEVAKAHATLAPATNGSAPPPAPQYKPGSAFGKDGKFDWNALHARAAAMLPS